MRMKKTGAVEDLAVVGTDIGKDSFHLVEFDRAGKLVLRKHIRRSALATTFEYPPHCVVCMDACRSAHFVSSALRTSGFGTRIIPP